MAYQPSEQGMVVPLFREGLEICSLARVRAGVLEKEKDTPRGTLTAAIATEFWSGTNNKEFWSAIASLNLLLSLSVNCSTSRPLELDSSLDGSLWGLQEALKPSSWMVN